MLSQIKEALKARGWTVQSSDDNKRTENMDTPKTYSAETVAELALELRTTSRLSWALHEQNAQLKKQLEELESLSFRNAELGAALKLAALELDQKTLKIQRLLTMGTTPVSVLDLGPGPMRELQRLRCKTIFDVTKLNKANAKNGKGYRLIFEAMHNYFEGL